ncbi:TonB-linked outer membrane protein, SusC/RagA family [Chitinophaga rupis]|uniref:TonB-linked outer membrane protein, SusC/RagA family n=1 Tax=Chitinophaga rupis TaxID=573321 RepID=A0A1H7UWP4_9BACT|nr:TonB-dependent receptor [Chitinophaga rupis]SEM01411.1 TonB-linked outer membrane protein, SusC/RagA family [Chitinophaga rupis]
MYRNFTEQMFGRPRHALARYRRILQFSCILLLTTALQLGARTYAQRVNIEVHEASLEDVLYTIQQQTGYDFLYSTQLIRSATPVSLSLKNMEVTEALKIIFDKQPLDYIINKKTVTLKNKPVLPPAVFTVHGTVTDNKGVPLQGVSIQLKGTTTGTASLADGTYSLNLPDANGTLTFGFIGFAKQEIAVNGKNLINVTLMEDDRKLTEVVVTGYTTQSRHTLTSAIATINGEDLTKRVATDATSLLQGQLPGLSVVQNSAEPGNETIQLRIRGVGTFSGAGNNPLVIVDGVPGNLSALNPNDIESVNVLKDASAAAIYGSQGANGVIVVKSKKGNPGKFTLSYNYNIGFAKATRLPKLITNSATYMTLLNEAEANSGNAPIYTDEQIALYQNATDRVKYPNHDWLKDMFSTATVQNHYLNLSGGTEKTTYSLGMGFTNQPGTMRGFEYKKYTVALGLTSRVHKRVTLGTNIQARYGDRQFPYNNATDLYISTLAQSPLYPAQTADGLWITKAYDRELGNKNPVLASTLRTSNPDYYGQGNISIDVDVAEGLKWENRAGINFEYYKMKTFRPVIPVYLYSDLSYSRNADVGTPGLAMDHHDETHSTIYSQLNYHKLFGSHDLTVLAGVQQETDNKSYMDANRIGYPTNQLTELNAGAVSGQTNGGTSEEWVIHSLYGNMNYNFKDKYLLGVSLRYDGTSRLPADSRWGLYQSVSGGWRISKESFLANVKWLNDLKIRASWGRLGNQNIGTYPYQSTLAQTNYAYASGILSGFIPNMLVDPNLTWETTRMTDIGVDMTAFNNRLSFTFDWFSKYTYDILRQSQVPQALGVSAPIVNNGAVSNKGVEFGVRYQDKLSKKFSYYAAANLQVYRNKLASFGADEIGGPDGQTIMRNGYPINSFYLQTMDGIFQSQEEINKSPDQSSLGGVPTPGDIKYKDVNGDGRVDANDRSVFEGQYPKFEYSYTMGANWGNFDASIQLYGSYGNKLYLYKWGVDPFAQGAMPTTDWLDRWTPENPSATKPKIYMGFYGYPKITNVPSSYYLFNASFMRIKNLQVGYTLPQSLVKGIRMIRVYAAVDNLALFTPLKIATDPERLDINNKPDAWYGFANYPQNRTFTLGASVQF